MKLIFIEWTHDIKTKCDFILYLHYSTENCINPKLSSEIRLEYMCVFVLKFLWRIACSFYGSSRDIGNLFHVGHMRHNSSSGRLHHLRKKKKKKR